ncbi:MAG: hypothetical protein AAFY00_03840, partial [Bacteroidota bacterium]
MSKLLLVYGCALLGSSAVADEQQSTVSTHADQQQITTSTFENNFTALNIDADVEGLDSTYYWTNENSFELNLNEIEYLEEENELDLGFGKIICG